ncbi:7-methylguanosine phosphate-specific 5'-nucleotidase-like [Corticium candelabrum]|uniref:7-methylguanosine phosphate-specific 5'-nucleotidase-like n=1 Tax=Corticium candelabrum TaxID=121492 RepID=UPI002E25B351|nr:7-methylguanosine phosphate-specific 5'-nucleotidase-like [Corticium candelabrum]
MSRLREVVIAAVAVGAGAAFLYCLLRKRKKPWNEWRRDGVYVRDPDDLQRKLGRMAADGASKLQVISDFDMTLTKFWINNQRGMTTHAILETSELLPVSFREKMTALKKKYYPIEISSTMEVKDKIHYMEAWWCQGHDALVSCNIHRSIIGKMVEQSNTTLRDGCQHLFAMLRNCNVPLMILSAGIGDLIDEVLNRQASLYRNIHVVANYMDYEENDMLVGFKGHLIHTFNKTENSVRSSDYFQEIKDRCNVVLLGDSHGDPHMADGVEHVANIVKIGFLNDEVESRFEGHMQRYDIVITGDPDLSLVNSLLSHILLSS